MSLKFNYAKIASLLLVSLMVWACEKDQTNPNTLSQNGVSENAQPDKGFRSQKSTILDDIQDYEDDLLSNTEPPTTEREEALLHMESIINHNEADASAAGNTSELVSFNVEVDISLNGSGDLEIEGPDALDFYADLESELQDAYEESDLYGEHGNDAYIAVVDLDIPETGSSGTESVGTNVLVKYILSPSFSSCSALDDWKALDLLGTCSGASVNSFDAARKLETMLNDGNCNSDKFGQLCTSIYFRSIGMGSSSGHSSSNIWDGTSVSQCIYASSITNNHFPNYQSEADSISGGSAPYITYIDYRVDKDIAPNNDVAHDLFVTYAQQRFHPCDP